MNFIQCMSVIQRNYYRYLDVRLEEFQIGAGQQFFLTYIYENEGITMFDLAKGGRFDKGTVTKGIQKLLEQGYVSVEIDEKDKRVRHLHTTSRAMPVIEKIYEIRKNWKDFLTEGMLEDDKKRLTQQLTVMAECSCRTLREISEKRESVNNGRNSRTEYTAGGK